MNKITCHAQKTEGQLEEISVRYECKYAVCYIDGYLECFLLF